MRIWIDLANSPHVPFFRALADEFSLKSHQLLITARDFAETVPLAEAAGFSPTIIGAHGGAKLSGKAGSLVQRGLALARWGRSQEIDLAVGHNSYSQVLAARALRIPVVTLMDYEHQPANHLAFRLASRIIVPRAFPVDSLNRFGAGSEKIRRYDGIKEDVYLATFSKDPNFRTQLAQLGISSDDILVTIRPPASEALYHRFENELFGALLDRLSTLPGVKAIFLPRNESQKKEFSVRYNNLILPSYPLDGANLIAESDLVISAGGTMNREAAALGVPAASIYQGEWSAVDEALVSEGRLRRISTLADIDQLPIVKKSHGEPRRATHVRAQVADLILANT